MNKYKVVLAILLATVYVQEARSIPYFIKPFPSQPNYTASIANPLKGLVPNTNIVKPNLTGVVYSLLSTYVPFDSVVVGVNNKGNNIYDWTSFEKLLNDTAKASKHAIPRFYIHYPDQGQENPAKELALPQQLKDTVNLTYFKTDKFEGYSPNYDDPILLKAIRQFITRFGQIYDGDRRIAVIQAGLLGKSVQGYV
jgi:hypothetical protein